MQFDRAVDPTGAPSPRPLTLASINSRFETGIRSPLDAAILQQAAADVAGYQEGRRNPVRLRAAPPVGGGGGARGRGSPAPHHERRVRSRSWRSTAFEAGGHVAPLDAATRQACAASHEHLSEDGLRVLAVAYRWLEPRAAYSRDDEADLVLAGFVSFADPVLPDVADVLAELKRDGVTVKILTGDNDAVARHVCRPLALDEQQIVTGDDIADSTTRRSVIWPSRRRSSRGSRRRRRTGSFSR